jgi:hypothetical protein
MHPGTFGKFFSNNVLHLQKKFCFLQIKNSNFFSSKIGNLGRRFRNQLIKKSLDVVFSMFSFHSMSVSSAAPTLAVFYILFFLQVVTAEELSTCKVSHLFHQKSSSYAVAINISWLKVMPWTWKKISTTLYVASLSFPRLLISKFEMWPFDKNCKFSQSLATKSRLRTCN